MPFGWKSQQNVGNQIQYFKLALGLKFVKLLIDGWYGWCEYSYEILWIFDVFNFLKFYINPITKITCQENV